VLHTYSGPVPSLPGTLAQSGAVVTNAGGNNGKPSSGSSNGNSNSAGSNSSSSSNNNSSAASASKVGSGFVAGLGSAMMAMLLLPLL